MSRFPGYSPLPFQLVFLMWALFYIQFNFGIDLAFLGIMPRTWAGLPGILFAPMIHGSLQHILGNTAPVLFLGSALYFFYGRIGNTVFFRCYLITNLLVWLLSPRASYHIGASGLVYGLSAFMILFGVLRKELIPLLLSVFIFLLYGGAFFYGVLPLDPRVSWESHLFGALVGAVSAVTLRKKKRVM
jgi:membrane associated rhomboid family serine protease